MFISTDQSLQYLFQTILKSGALKPRDQAVDKRLLPDDPFRMEDDRVEQHHGRSKPGTGLKPLIKVLRR